MVELRVLSMDAHGVKNGSSRRNLVTGRAYVRQRKPATRKNLFDMFYADNYGQLQ